jgi:hypothetical protein
MPNTLYLAALVGGTELRLSFETLICGPFQDATSGMRVTGVPDHRGPGSSDTRRSGSYPGASVTPVATTCVGTLENPGSLSAGRSRQHLPVGVD